MQIYSFEYTPKTIKWKIFEYKGMKFIGTDSIRFQSNRNFIRVDGLNNPDSIKLDLCTFYKPIGEITESCKVDINPYNMNISLRSSEINGGDNLLIIVIDKTCMDMRALEKYYENEKFVSLIRKIITDEYIILLFNIKEDKDNGYRGTLFEFKTKNYLLRGEEIHQVQYSYSIGSKLSLVSRDISNLNEIENNRERFNLIFHEPITRNFIVRKENEEELINYLDTIQFESRITSIDTTDTMENIIPCIVDMIGTANAVTYYKMSPIKSDVLNDKIKYNFIMLETGKIIEAK